ALHPSAAYCAPTTVCGTSLGVNENGCRHLRQKPSVRPGSPSRPRPTGWLHSGLPQYRLFSGMLGFSNRTSAMSLMSGGGSSTREAARTWVPVAAARVVPLRGVPVRGLLVPTFRGATVAALAGAE